MSTEYEKTALLALPAVKEGSVQEAGLLSWSRPYLIDQIRQNGVDVAVTRGVSKFDEQNAAVSDVLRPEYSSDTKVVLHSLGQLGLDQFDVVRNIVRAVRTDTTTPFLNPNSIRDLARDKHTVMSTVLRPAGVDGRNAVFLDGETSNTDAIARIDSLHGDTVVAKPNGGQRSRGVIVGSKADVINALRDIPEPYIVEEKLDFSHAFPSIRAINESEQARLDLANGSGVNKEVRRYYFGNGVWDTVGRVAQVGETDFATDKWLYLDEDSIPDDILRGDAEVVSRLSSIVGHDEFNIALDWVYASSASRPEPSWQAMELNAAEPQLIQIGENPEIGRRQHRKLAEQISRIALS